MKLDRKLTNFFRKLKAQKFSKLAGTALSLSTLGFLSLCAQSVSANDSIDYIGNKGVQFQEDTTIEFEFIQSHGAYQSTFGVIDLESCRATRSRNIDFDSCKKTPLLAEAKPSDSYQTVTRRSSYRDDLNRSDEDFIGTPGNTVIQPMAEFTFEEGKRYAFYLESYYEGKLVGVVYSVDYFNDRNYRQALFNEEIPTQLATRRNVPKSERNQFPSLVEGGLLLRFDDTGSTLVRRELQDADFDDFIVGIGGYDGCLYPEQEQ